MENYHKLDLIGEGSFGKARYSQLAASSWSSHPWLRKLARRQTTVAKPASRRVARCSRAGGSTPVRSRR